MKKDVLILIPAYNEEHTIGKLLEQLLMPEIRMFSDILVLNDASGDSTGQVCEDYGVEVITHMVNLGYGNSLRVGYKYAALHGYKYVIQMDADGQHDVCNILPIYRALTAPDDEGLYPDIVLGARFMEGSQDYKISAPRKFAYIFFRKMLAHMTGKHLHDCSTGLQGLSRRAFTYYCGNKSFEEKYPDANLLVRMILLGYRVVEIPAVMHSREAGRSMLFGYSALTYMVYMFFSVIASYFRARLIKMQSRM